MSGKTDSVSAIAQESSEDVRLLAALHVEFMKRAGAVVAAANEAGVPLHRSVSVHGVSRAVFDALPVRKGGAVQEWRSKARGVYWSKDVHPVGEAYCAEPRAASSPEPAEVHEVD